MVNKAVVSYILGAGVGSLVTFVATKKYYQKIANEEIASVKEAVLKRNAKLYSVEPDENPQPQDDEVEESETDEETIEKMTNYSKIYQGGGEVDGILNTLAEREHPDDDEKPKKKSRKAPRIIKAADYDSYPEYRKLTVFYFVGDGIIADEDDETELEKLGTYNDLVGKCLEKYGFTDNDETVIFVRNEQIMADFEIMKNFGTFADVRKEE